MKQKKIILDPAFFLFILNKVKEQLLLFLLLIQFVEDSGDLIYQFTRLNVCFDSSFMSIPPYPLPLSLSVSLSLKVAFSGNYL